MYFNCNLFNLPSFFFYSNADYLKQIRCLSINEVKSLFLNGHKYNLEIIYFRFTLCERRLTKN